MNSGVARVYTPKDFDLNAIITDIAVITSQHPGAL